MIFRNFSLFDGLISKKNILVIHNCWNFRCHVSECILCISIDKREVICEYRATHRAVIPDFLCVGIPDMECRRRIEMDFISATIQSIGAAVSLSVTSLSTEVARIEVLWRRQHDKAFKLTQDVLSAARQ